MSDQNEDDFNDLMFEINEEPQRHDIASVDTDRGIASSISNTGVDADDPEENRRYIRQNQDHRAIIQGIGVAAIQSDRDSEITEGNKESGLATSISKTRSSEFVPEIIEYQSEDSSRNADELTATIEPEPGPSSGVRYGYDPKYDDSKKLAESLQELDIVDVHFKSAFDLALAKGYRDQAKIAHDDATSKGLQIETKHIDILKDFTDDLQRETGCGNTFWSKDYSLQRMYMLKKDFKEYLEDLNNNNHKKVLQHLNNKKELTEVEKQIKKNIKTKENRNNLKGETITIIEDYIERLENLEKCVKLIGEDMERKKRKRSKSQ